MVTNGGGKMNNDMKCPFCQQDLCKFGKIEKDHTRTIQGAYCPHCKIKDSDIKLWQELIRTETENKDLSDKIGKLETELEKTRKALDYCIERFKSLENVLDEKAEASDIPDNPDLYAWAVRIKPIWGELKEITGIDYTTEHK